MNIRSTLLACEAYFEERADGEYLYDGALGNEEMSLLGEVREALRGLSVPVFGPNDAPRHIPPWEVAMGLLQWEDRCKAASPVNTQKWASQGGVMTEAQQWQPIETAPTDGRWFLALPRRDLEIASHIPPAAVRVIREDTHGFLVECRAMLARDEQRLSLFTHWMPLLERPE